ncbi:MAG: MFS transporter [Deltaproteobacteria bacterium]|nr:MAG: MFS transporter [Deltaproteobacteria bacterium]
MSKRSPLLPIFLVVLVDVLGFTIVYPLLPFYALKFGASKLVATTLVSVYALCSLFSTPVIGRLSDQFGRRRLLLLSQAGTFAGFLVLAASSSLWMLFLGRILDGLTAGNLSTAQAYISDHTRPENRAKAFGMIGIAFGIGFFFGPAMAGWLGHYGIHGAVPEGQSGELPFLVAACLSVVSMVCTYTLLEPGVSAAPAPGGTGPGGQRPPIFDLSFYLAYFRRPGLGSLYLQFVLFTFSFSAFMGGFALFASGRFTTSDGRFWGSREVGYLFAYSGFLGIILQGGLIGRLVKRFGEARLTLAGFVASVTAYLVLGFTTTLPLLIAVSTIAAFGHGVLRPVITSEITQQVGRHEQGVALGISGSLSSLAMTLAPPTGGVLLDRDWLTAWTLVPATAAALGLIAALITRARRSTAAPAAPATPATPSAPAAPSAPATPSAPAAPTIIGS